MKKWISTSVIYQINLRSLAFREPRNAIEAVKEKPVADSPIAYVMKNLSTIKKLGVNVLYFMPPFEIGDFERKGIGSPYATKNFNRINPEFGTEEEMADLVRKAHKMGFKVIFDITPNHTSRDNVWTQTNPEYYVKRDDGSLYHDTDWSDTAKLDYTQPGLRREMIDFYDRWLSFLGTDADGQPDGVDGFRLDMAHFINDKSFWNEAMPILKERHSGRQLLFLAECYGIDNNLDLFERGINSAYDDDFYKNLQHLYGVTAEVYKTRIVPDLNIDHIDYFRDRHEAFKSGGIAGAFERAILNYDEKVKQDEEGPFVARYTDNHDEGRAMYLYGEGAVRAVNALIFMAPHTLPFIMTGEEFGACNRPPIHDRINPIGKKRRIVEKDHIREQESVEFEGNTFLRTFEERQALYSYFKDLVAMRKKNPALAKGSFELWDTGEQCDRHDRAVIAFIRKYRGKKLLCAVNLGPEDRELANAGTISAGTTIYGKLNGNTLPAFSAVVSEVA